MEVFLALLAAPVGQDHLDQQTFQRRTLCSGRMPELEALLSCIVLGGMYGPSIW